MAVCHKARHGYFVNCTRTPAGALAYVQGAAAGAQAGFRRGTGSEAISGDSLTIGLVEDCSRLLYEWYGILSDTVCAQSKMLSQFLPAAPQHPLRRRFPTSDSFGWDRDARCVWLGDRGLTG